MMLVDLPLEILQLILTHATTPSFLQITRTCHQLWHLASGSREILLHHLAQIPGIKLGLEDLTTLTSELFVILRRRAALNLYGANFHADRKTCNFGDSSINVSASCLYATKFRGVRRIALATGDDVRIYSLHSGSTPSYRQTLSHMRLPVLRTSFDRSDNVIVLYGAPFDDGSHVLAYHKASASNYMPIIFRMEGSRGFTPSSLAVHDRERFAVLFSRGNLSRDEETYTTDTAIALYQLKTLLPSWAETSTSKEEEQSLDTRQFFSYSGAPCPHVAGGNFTTSLLYPPLKDGANTSELQGPLNVKLPEAVASRVKTTLKPTPVKVAFSNSGRRLRCYASDGVVPAFRLDVFDKTWSENAAVGKISIGGWEFLLDNPFFGKHESDEYPDTGGARCTTHYLVLGTTQIAKAGQIICVISSHDTTSGHGCDHKTSLDSFSARSRNNVVVARLWGIGQTTVTSLPGLVAHSKLGSRIAIARWDKIYVWPLDTEHLCEQHDYDLDPNNGSGYYDMVWDAHIGTHAELKPVVLNAESVVRQMIFGESEDEIIVLASAGLQIWNIGPSGTGKRSSNILAEWRDDMVELIRAEAEVIQS